MSSCDLLTRTVYLSRKRRECSQTLHSNSWHGPHTPTCVGGRWTDTPSLYGHEEHGSARVDVDAVITIKDAKLQTVERDEKFQRCIQNYSQTNMAIYLTFIKNWNVFAMYRISKKPLCASTAVNTVGGKCEFRLDAPSRPHIQREALLQRDKGEPNNQVPATCPIAARYSSRWAGFTHSRRSYDNLGANER